MTESDSSFHSAAIVLGGGLRVVEKDDVKIYLPEPQVEVRLSKAYELYITREVDYIVTTGKFSKRIGIDPYISGPQSEAQVGKKYLIDRFDVSEKDILCEEESYDTIGNAWFAKIKCLIPHRIFTVAVITSEYHMERSRLIFDWVLGPKYKIQYISVPSNLSERDRAVRGELEQVFIDFMQKYLFNSIKPGDDQNIWNFMEREHIRYCLLERSEAMLETLVKTAAIKAGYRQNQLR